MPGIGVGRDGARTPMQWNCSPFAGFSGSEPWLPLSADWATRNVDMLRQDKNSIYVLYRRLIEARRHSQALRRGLYRPIPSKGDLLLYVREFGSERMLMALNLPHLPLSGSRRASRAPYLSRLQASTMVILSTKPFAWMPTRAWSSLLRQTLSFHPLANELVAVVTRRLDSCGGR